MEQQAPWFAVAAVILAVFGYQRWQSGVKLFFLLVVLDGAIRKWVFPEAQQLIYFLKDFLLVGAYVRILTAGLRLPTPRFAEFWVQLNILIAIIVTVQVFNSALPTIVLGMVGWKSYLLYVPLVFLVAYLYDSTDALLRALKYYSLLAFAVVGLSVLQFAEGGESALNAGLFIEGGGMTEQAGFVGVERVRVAGPFPFLTGLTAYCSAMLSIALILLISKREQSSSNSWYAYLLASACFLGILMSGSRGPIVINAAMIVTFFFLSFKLGSMQGRQILQLGFGAIAMYIAMTWILPEATDAWSARTTEVGFEGDSIFNRIEQTFSDIFRVMDFAGIIGYGTGAVHNAAGALTGDTEIVYSWLPTVAEGEPARIMLELGIPAWLIVYASRILIIYCIWHEASKMTDRTARGILAAVVANLLVLLPSHIVINPVANAYYFGAIGIAFALIRLSQGPEYQARPTAVAFARAKGAR